MLMKSSKADTRLLKKAAFLGLFSLLISLNDSHAQSDAMTIPLQAETFSNERPESLTPPHLVDDSPLYLFSFKVDGQLIPSATPDKCSFSRVHDRTKGTLTIYTSAINRSPILTEGAPPSSLALHSSAAITIPTEHLKDGLEEGLSFESVSQTGYLTQTTTTYKNQKLTVIDQHFWGGGTKSCTIKIIEVDPHLQHLSSVTVHWTGSMPTTKDCNLEIESARKSIECKDLAG